MKFKILFSLLLGLFMSFSSFAITLNANATSNNGTGGIFFTLTTNTSPVVLTAVNTMFGSAAASPVSVEIYTRTGPYAGFTTAVAGWTLLGTINTVSAGTTVLAPINLTSLNINIPAATTQSFYFHSTTAGGGIRYFGTGTTSVTTFNDANLTLFSDVARTGAVAFGGTANTPRALTGTIEYNLAGPPCNAPTGLNATGITSTSANTSWTAVTGAVGYEYAVNTSATAPTGPGTAQTGTTYNATALTPGTSYYLHVRTNCGTGFSTWTTYNFTTPCPAPTGLAATGITTTTANTSWTAVTGALGYEYAVTTSSTPPASGTAQAGTTYNATGLNHTTAYYLHVRTQCNASTFSTWTTFPFTTQSPLCNAPTGLAASGLSTTGVTLNWNAVTSSIGYEYAINTSSTPPPSGVGITPNTYTGTGLTPGTTYYAHVRNKCSASLFSSWTTITFNTPYPPCNPPNVAVSNITVGGLTISWAPVSGAVGYEYAINTTATPPSGGATTAATTETIAGLIDNTPYFVHVRTNCGAGGFSSWVTVPFNTAAYCTAPAAIISNIGDSKADINWNAMSSAVSYEYVVTTSITPPSVGTATPGLNYNSRNLNPGTQYYIHLLSVCAADKSNWSTSGFMTTAPAGINDINKNALQVYPNPVQDVLTVKLALAPGKNAALAITDITGKTMKQLPVSAQEFRIELNDIPVGVYMLRFTDDATNQVIKIHKQ